MQVFDLIEKIKATDCAAEYGAYAVELPAMIRHNGLLQSLAFLAHKGPASGVKARERAARQLHDQLLDVLRRTDNDIDIAAMNSPDYAVCTRCALEAAQYFKRFAESVLGVDRASAEQTS